MPAQDVVSLFADPSLAGLLRLAQRAWGSRLHVALPGVVTAFDAVTKLVDVQPLLKTRKDGDQTATTPAVIPRVPVAWPMTAAAAVYMPIAKGDPVMLVFSDRALDRWKTGTGAIPAEPRLDRQHELTDCWAVPGGFPTGNPFTATYGDGNFQVVLAPGVKAAVGNGTAELLQLASDAFTSLKEAAEELKKVLAGIQLLTVSGVVSGGGVSDVPVNAATFAAIESTVDTIISGVDGTIASLDTIKV